jgi:23S rRNA (uracil1939-C5)-methyltransferase
VEAFYLLATNNYSNLGRPHMSSDSPYGKALEKAKSHNSDSSSRPSQNSSNKASKPARSSGSETPYGKSSSDRPRNDRSDSRGEKRNERTPRPNRDENRSRSKAQNKSQSRSRRHSAPDRILDTLEIVTEKMVPGGKALARLDGQIVLIEGALPEERVLVDIYKKKKGFMEGKVNKVLEASQYRRKAECMHYGACGGCDMQEATVEGQRKFKQEMLIETLQRQGRIQNPPMLEMVGGAEWDYRVRARFVKTQGGWGFRKKNSNDTVLVDECPIMNPDLLEAVIENRNLQKDRQEVQLFCGESQDNLIAGVGNTSFTSVELLGKKIVADNRGFFQSNTEVFRMLLENELSDLKGGLAVDLFSGVGPFAAILEDRFDQVIAVEADERCLRVAKKNLKKTKFFTEKAEEWAVSHPDLEPDLLVVDPPREGLDAKLIKMIASWKPKKVLYVSCDPVTQARDLRIFLEETHYELVSVRGYDFYPQTHHMEAVAWLELKD